MISKREIEHLARLAKIFLSKEEIERLQREISKVLDYVEKLKEVDVEGVEPMTHPLLIENVKRRDEEILKFDFEREKFFEQFSEKEGDFLKVKKII